VPMRQWALKTMLQLLQRRCRHVVLVAGDLCMQAVELMLRPRCRRHWPASARRLDVARGSYADPELLDH